MTKDLLARPLPKWPKMLTAGAPVTVDQAKEIIRRTDMFFCGFGGNDHKWDEAVRKALRLPPRYDERQLPEDEAERNAYFEKERKFQESWAEKWGYLGMGNYVHNEWLSTCFADGPHGWCRPDGKIGYVYNVGKWPTVSDICEEWASLATTFPFLDLGAVLMSAEHREEDRKPIVSLRVSGGAVRLHDPEVDVHAGFEVPKEPTEDEREVLLQRFLRNDVHGIPSSWIEEWAVMAEKLMGDEYRRTFG